MMFLVNYLDVFLLVIVISLKITEKMSKKH